MANGYDGSRSPVRAINSASHPTWASALPRPPSWSEPGVHEITSPPAATVEAPALACPDCGAHVRLVLVPDTEAPVREGTAQRKNLHAAPNPLPDFESSVRQHKRELIARALEENDGVMTRAAKAVGLKYTTFVAMVHRLDATDEEPDTRAD